MYLSNSRLVYAFIFPQFCLQTPPSSGKDFAGMADAKTGTGPGVSSKPARSVASLIEFFFRLARDLEENTQTVQQISQHLAVTDVTNVLTSPSTPLLLRRACVKCLNVYLVVLRDIPSQERSILFVPPPEVAAAILNLLKRTIRQHLGREAAPSAMIPYLKLVAGSLWCLEGLLRVSSAYPAEHLPLEEVLAVVLLLIRSGGTHSGTSEGNKEHDLQLNLRLEPDPYWKMGQAEEEVDERQNSQLIPRPKKNKKKKATSHTPSKTIVSLKIASEPVVNSFSSKHPTSSESDCSSDRGEGLKRRSQVKWAAYDALAAVVRAVKGRKFFCFWSSFLPAYGEASFLSFATRESSYRLRMSAAYALTQILEESRLFFSVAEEPLRPVESFTPFSHSLGTCLRSLHGELLSWLRLETSPLVTIQIIKSMNMLVHCTPYTRLQPGLATALLQEMKVCIENRDFNIVVGALTIFGSLLSHHSSLTELDALLCDRLPSPIGVNGEHRIRSVSQAEHESWLCAFCVAKLKRRLESKGKADAYISPIAVECLQVLSAFTKARPHLCRPQLQEMAHIISLCLVETDKAFQHHGLVLLEAVGRHLLVLPSVSVDFALDFWLGFLRGPLPTLMRVTTYCSMKVVICDVLATVSNSVLEHLPEPQRITCVSILMTQAYDEDTFVRGAAVRGLGYYLEHSCMREDTGFLWDALEALMDGLKCHGDRFVLIKSSWAVGNLLEAITLEADDASPSICFFEEAGRPGVLNSLCQLLVQRMRDHPKVKIHVARALGLLMSTITAEQIESVSGDVTLKDTVIEAVCVLTTAAKTGNDMKARWNSVYSIGRAFSNRVVLQVLPTIENTIKTLVSLVGSFKNMKVRIHSAWALRCLPSRDYYGAQYLSCWESVVSGLGYLPPVISDQEIRLKTEFVDELCSLICHLILVIDISKPAAASDLDAVSELLAGQRNVVLDHMSRFSEREVPEKSSILLTAERHLNSMKSTGNTSLHTLNVVRLIAMIFPSSRT